LLVYLLVVCSVVYSQHSVQFRVFGWSFSNDTREAKRLKRHRPYKIEYKKQSRWACIHISIPNLISLASALLVIILVDYHQHVAFSLDTVIVVLDE
jgi:hypothetical protein